MFCIYHIRLPPLNVTIFISHLRNCVMGAKPMFCAYETSTEISWFSFNPFKPNGISHYYHLDQSISILRDV